jgi:hypothetical protein
LGRPRTAAVLPDESHGHRTDDRVAITSSATAFAACGLAAGGRPYRCRPSLAAMSYGYRYTVIPATLAVAVGQPLRGSEPAARGFAGSTVSMVGVAGRGTYQLEIDMLPRVHRAGLAHNALVPVFRDREDHSEVDRGAVRADVDCAAVVPMQKWLHGAHGGGRGRRPRVVDDPEPLVAPERVADAGCAQGERASPKTWILGLIRGVWVT